MMRLLSDRRRFSFHHRRCGALRSALLVDRLVTDFDVHGALLYCRIGGPDVQLSTLVAPSSSQHQTSPKLHLLFPHCFDRCLMTI